MSTPLTANEILEELVVTPPSDTSTYSRELFGDNYVDVDGDCRDTRDEVLVRDSERTTTGQCQIQTGFWKSEYESFSTEDASELTIDHLVALKEAWISGASDWSEDRRQRFFNDLGSSFSLSIMSRSLNSEKGENDPGTWLPAQSLCTYVVHWVAVKYRWTLAIDRDEKSAILEVLDGSCGETEIDVEVAD